MARGGRSRGPRARNRRRGDRGRRCGRARVFSIPRARRFFTTSFAVARSKLFRLVVSDFAPLGLDGYFRGDLLGASIVTLALVGGVARLAWALRRSPFGWRNGVIGNCPGSLYG